MIFSQRPAHFLLFSANQMQEKDHIQRGIFCINHTFLDSFPYLDERKLQSEMLFSPNSFLFLEPFRISTQNGVNFNILAVSLKRGENRKR